MKVQKEVNEMLHYMNDPSLKACNVKLTYTEEQIQERIKCSNDPIYFIENYVKIVNLDHGLINFKMYDFQKKLVETFDNNRFTVAKLSRQVGKSTVTVAYLLWVVLFQANQNIAILANKKDVAVDILDRLQTSYKSIPLWMQQGVVAWNAGNIELENGSKIVAESTSSDSIRGKSFNIIFLDEFAFVPHNVASNFITSVFPTVSSGKTSKIIVVSTPNGLNHFYKLWTDALKPKGEGWNGFIPIEAHWSEVPGRDQEWYESTFSKLGKEKFDQEFGAEFLGSSRTLINSKKLQTLAWTPPIYVDNEGLAVYEHPKPEHIYVLIADTARGLGLDSSAFSVIDVTSAPYKQVARFKNKDISTLIYPNVIFNVGKRYNNAYLLIESQDCGKQVADILHGDLEAENILSTVNRGRGGQHIILGSLPNSKLGVMNSTNVKSVGCNNLKALIETEQLIIKDFDTISELTTFVVNKKSWSADEGYNDDLVTTIVIFAWFAQQKIFKEISNKNIHKLMTEEKLRTSQETSMPLGFVDLHDEADNSFVDKQGILWTVVEEYDIDDF